MNPTSSANTSTGGLTTQILNWVGHPFQSQGSAFNWILFVGLLVVAAWFWQTVLISLENRV